MDTITRSAEWLKSDQWEGEAEAQNVVVGVDVDDADAYLNPGRKDTIIRSEEWLMSAQWGREADADDTTEQNEVTDPTIPTLPGPEWFPEVTGESYDFGTHRPKDILPIWCAMVTLNLSPKDPRFNCLDAREALKKELDALVKQGGHAIPSATQHIDFQEVGITPAAMESARSARTSMIATLADKDGGESRVIQSDAPQAYLQAAFLQEGCTPTWISMPSSLGLGFQNGFLGVLATLELVRCCFDMSSFLEKPLQRFVQDAGTQKPSKCPNVALPSGKALDKMSESEGSHKRNALSHLMKVMYGARMAAPHLLLSINRLSSQVTRWTKAYDQALAQIFRYIAGSGGKGMLVGGFARDARNCDDMHGACYADADLSGDSTRTAKSTTGYWVEFVSDGHRSPIAWCSKRQTSTPASTAEAELAAMTSAVKDSLSQCKSY
eukprot:6480976-Amphidinium_carterae.3